MNAAGSSLVYSTYLGGSNNDYGSGIAVDSAGNAYVTGFTSSTDFPTLNAIQPTSGGQYDAFVTKINADGTAYVYSTYLGGSANDNAYGVAADSAGNAYVTGFTASTDFPTVNAIQPTSPGLGDAFVTKINASGNALVYSTYLGGSASDQGNGIAVDSAGNAYITGYTFSADFPTASAVQPNLDGPVDAFVTKINSSGSALTYSTYLGGSNADYGDGIAVDSTGNAYVTGYTDSLDFPMVNAIQPIPFGGRRGYTDAFVTKYNAAGSAVVYSTYSGGSRRNAGSGIAADSTGSAYVTGWTTSAKKFPITLLAFQQSLKGGYEPDAFVAKIAQQTFVNVLPKKKLAFAEQVVGITSKAKKITVTNQGSGTLTINQIYVAGADPGDFAETNTCGSALAAGASCKISVTFTPSAVGKRSALLGISDSDPASPQAVALTGTGT